MATTLPSIPKYTILSSSYATFKGVWSAGKDYKLVSTAENIAETVASKALSVTSSIHKVSTLRELDVILRPALIGADVNVAPIVEKTVSATEEAVKKAEPVIKVAMKFLPVSTAGSLYAIFMGIFTKNMERVGNILLIENPETSTD